MERIPTSTCRSYSFRDFFRGSDSALERAFHVADECVAGVLTCKLQRTKSVPQLLAQGSDLTRGRERVRRVGPGLRRPVKIPAVDQALADPFVGGSKRGDVVLKAFGGTPSAAGLGVGPAGKGDDGNSRPVLMVGRFPTQINRAIGAVVWRKLIALPELFPERHHKLDVLAHTGLEFPWQTGGKFDSVPHARWNRKDDVFALEFLAAGELHEGLVLCRNVSGRNAEKEPLGRKTLRKALRQLLVATMAPPHLGLCPVTVQIAALDHSQIAQKALLRSRRTIVGLELCF